MGTAGKRWKWGKQNALLSCAACGKSFKRFLSEIKKAKTNYCSPACKLSAHKGTSNPNYRGGNTKKTCKNCGTNFDIFPSRAKKGDGSYCSRKCKHAHLRIFPDIKTGRREHRRRREYRVKTARKNCNHHTHAEWMDLLAKHNGQCVHCGTTINITRDHIKPVSKGGDDTIENIQPLCKSCNSRKYNKL